MTRPKTGQFGVARKNCRKQDLDSAHFRISSSKMTLKSIKRIIFALLAYELIALPTRVSREIWAGEEVALPGGVGTLSTGQLVEAGEYALVVPPIRTADGKDVVVVSAPRAQWIVKGGPYVNPRSANSQRQEGFDECELNRVSAAREDRRNQTINEANADDIESRARLDEAVSGETNWLAIAHSKSARDLAVKFQLRAIQLESGKCEKSDGSENYRFPSGFQEDTDAPLMR